MKILEGFLVQAKECHENSPRERPEGTSEFVLLQFILDMSSGWEEEGRSLDHCPDFLNLEASLSTNNTGGSRIGVQLHLSHTAQCVCAGDTVRFSRYHYPCTWLI